MAELLLEILTEEIPARMQVRAEADMQRLLMDRLNDAGLLPEAVRTLSGPRRLVFVADGLPERTADVREERKGPRLGSPDGAIQGFLKAAGLTSLEQARIVEDGKKGSFYVADSVKPGRDTVSVIAEAVPAMIRAFPWPKSMRWGPNALSLTGETRWVRPIQRIVCMFDGEIVPFDVDGIHSGNLTEGHRVMGRGPFAVRRFEDYEQVLRARGHVVLDRDERKASLLADARTLCQARNLELVEDEGLANEVAGLVECPVAILGDMEPSFLDLPPEVIRLSMRTHQKYFAVRDPDTGRLAPHFVTIANLKAKDGGAKIAAGNARVLSARLSDARHFWDLDRKLPLDAPERVEKLKALVFHEKLGSVWDKAARVAALAERLTLNLLADPALAHRAAMLAKADLVTEMVGEFPELQGVMGRYYAFSTPLSGRGEIAEEGITAIADAIRDHYKPQGPSDSLPESPVGLAVALADKLDTLAGFWAIGEKPTGSGDPYALRRAALGVIRMVVEGAGGEGLSQPTRAAFDPSSPPPSPQGEGELRGKRPSPLGEGSGVRGLRFSLRTHLYHAASANLYLPHAQAVKRDGRKIQSTEVIADSQKEELRVEGLNTQLYEIVRGLHTAPETATDLLAFFHDRLKVWLREQGFAHDIVTAAMAPGADGLLDDDLARVVAKVKALDSFLKTEDGRNLLAGFKRGVNILKAEEKKDPSLAEALRTIAFDPAIAVDAEERALAGAIGAAEHAAADALRREDFVGTMAALATLRGPVDAFFETVLVNAADTKIRLNRLALLTRLRAALQTVADFALIEG